VGPAVADNGASPTIGREARQISLNNRISSLLMLGIAAGELSACSGPNACFAHRFRASGRPQSPVSVGIVRIRHEAPLRRTSVRRGPRGCSGSPLSVSIA